MIGAADASEATSRSTMTSVNGDVRVEGTTTQGTNSPGVVFGTVTYGITEDNQKVPVEYRRARPSRAGARLSAAIAFAATVVSAVAAVIPLVVPVPVWRADLTVSTLLNPVESDVILRSEIALVLLMLGVFVSARAWGAFHRRRLRLPKLGHRWSPLRSLIPRSPHSREYVRTTAVAQCSECREDNRVTMAVIRRPGRRDGGAAYTRCALGHVIRFRANGLFYDAR
jgi:hypothetical protein